MIITKHFKIRAKNRGFSDWEIDKILNDGQPIRLKGTCFLYFFNNKGIVIDENSETLITCKHIYKKIRCK